MKIALVILAMIIWVLICIPWYCSTQKACTQKSAPVVPAAAAPVVKAPEVVKPIVEAPEPIIEVEKEVVVEKQAFVCTDYLQGSLKLDSAANTTAEAKKLEEFLNQYEGGKLTVDGAYGAEDEAAVRAFQNKYKAEVLTPLDLTGPTGHVLGYTRAQINKLYCGYKEKEQN